MRGVSTLAAFGVEVGGWTRFTGNSIGAFVGWVPAEYSFGRSRSLGSSTKTGNGHARGLLVEAAWHHKRIYHVGAVMRGVGSPRRWLLGLAGISASIASTTVGSGSFSARSVRPSRSHASSLAGAGHWRSWMNDPS
ncbi:MAG: transposase [Pseudoclavibacter sp.]